jgi:hypothetical protein
MTRSYTQVEPDVVVVYPVNDLIPHDVRGEDRCVCGPAVEPVKRRDGSVSWVYTHNSLDGREHAERATA